MSKEFTAFGRSLQGTGASRRLRRTGRVPGIVYGGAAKPQAIELDHNSLWHALKKEEFHSSILDMTFESAKSQVLLRDVQYHPFRPQVLHIDFQRVDANTQIHMKVPLHFSGAENSPAVKIGKCIVSHVLNEVEISCLPKDLPQFIAIDLSAIETGKSLHVDDVKLPAGVKVITHGKRNPVIATAVVPKEEEVATDAPTAGEVVATAQKAPVADAKGGDAKGGKPGDKAAAKPAAKPAAKK